MSSFWLLCENGTCHCDWRVTLVDCVERDDMLAMCVVNLALSAIMLIIGAAILFHKICQKKLLVFYTVPFTYFVRPRPIESLLVFGVIFSALRIISMIIIIKDIAPNPIFRAFFYELPWQFGICALNCYMFGIAHTVSDSYKITERWSLFSARRIDIIFTFLIICPFIINNALTIAAAVYAQKDDYYLAKIFTGALYYMWTLYCLVLSLFSFYFGFGLLELLNIHFKNQERENEATIVKTKYTILKARVLIITIILAQLIFAIIKCIYASLREPILKNRTYSLIMASIWTFDGTVASIFIVSTLSINPKLIFQSFFNLITNSKESSCNSNKEITVKNSPEDNGAYQKQIYSEELTYFEAQKDQYEMVTEKARTKQKKTAQKIFNIPSKHDFIVY